VRVLAVSDEVDEVLWADADAMGDVDLLVACGDLPFEYLAHLMDALDVPLVFVPGNHDPDVAGYRESRSGLIVRAGLPAEPPWPPGAVNADGHVVDVGGLRIGGLGGSLRYSSGPNQYSQGQQRRRARQLARRARRRRRRDGRGLDLLITHAPPRGVGDGDDRAHHGFTALHQLAESLAPPLLLHGHVPLPGPTGPAHPGRIGRTVVRNVVGRHVIEVQTEAPAPRDGDRAA